MTLIEWLNKLEEKIQELRKIYVKDGDRRYTEFSDYYFDHATEAYLNIIIILKPFSTNPAKLFELFSSASKTALINQLMDEFSKIDSARYVPFIFHPIYNRQKGKYFLRPDIKCYFLLRVLSESLIQFQTEVDHPPLMKKLSENGLLQIIKTISERIFRFELNKGHFFSLVQEYEFIVFPKLFDMQAAIKMTPLDESQQLEFLASLQTTHESIKKWPACTAQFLRDDPQALMHMRQNDHYPELLKAFFKPIQTDENDDHENAILLYKTEIDARTINLGIGATNFIHQILYQFKLQYPTTTEKVTCLLIKIQEELSKTETILIPQITRFEYKSKSTVFLWTHEIAKNLSTLVRAFHPYSTFDHRGFHFLITDSQKSEFALKKILKFLYFQIYPLYQMSLSKDNMYGFALISIFTELVETSHRILKRHIKEIISQLGAQKLPTLLATSFRELTKCLDVDAFEIEVEPLLNTKLNKAATKH